MAPSIGSINGTLNHGESITITGTGFGAKSPAAPLVWDTFEGQTVGNTPSVNATIGTWSGVGDNGDMHISSSPVYGPGSRAVHLDSTANGRDFFINCTTGDSSRIYMYCKRRYAVSPDWNQKILYIYPASGYYPSPLIAYNTGGQWGVQNIDLSHWFSESGAPAGGVWVTHEFILQNNSALDVRDGIFRYEQNCHIFVNQTNTLFRDSSESGSMHIFHFSNYSDTATQIDLDDHYFDNTWARIMIGNNASFSSCTNKEIQIPSSWSSSSATFTVNRGAFASDASAYLFLVDANGDASSGLTVTFGTNYGGSPPAAPTNLRII